jgi:hypothetical protein
MTPLTIEDLLPLEVYAPRRREFFDSHRRYIDRYRRVRIGPRLTLIFENRQTLWFRVQEIVRVARLSARSEVEQELRLYNRLLPAGDLLQAALLLDVADDWTKWRQLDGEHLRLVIGAHELPSRLVTSRPEDRCVGTAHWVQFAFDVRDRELLADFTLPAVFRFDDEQYCHSSNPLADDLRHSLLEDLVEHRSSCA